MKKYQVMLVGVLLSSLALAQTRPTGQVADLLNDLNEAACKRDDASAGQSRVNDPVAARIAQPDLRCEITVQELSPLLGKAETVLVDTRHDDAYNAGHIDASLHLPAYAIKNQLFLKNSSVVLLGSGKADRELLTTCAELKSAGFKNVRVLRGGVLAWGAAQMPWVGQDINLNQLGLLTASDLSVEATFDGNVILSVHSMGSMNGTVPKAIAIADTRIETLKAALARRKKELKTDQFATLVLLADAQFNKTRIAEIEQALKPVPVLVYADTPQAYAQHLATQKAIWTAQARGPKQSKCQYR